MVKPVLYKKPSRDVKIMTYFEEPYEEIPVGAYKGRAQLQLKWLVMNPQGYEVKPNILSIYLLYKY